MRAPGGAHRARPERQDQPQIGVRPEELLLSRSAAGLPDQPVQIADRGRGRSHWSTCRRRDGARRNRAAPSRAGRRKLLHDQHADHVARRPQSLRCSADGDRQRGRICARPRTRRPSWQAAHHPALPRHLRRRHGEGSLARRREHLGAQTGRRFGHALRDQEPQLDPLHRPGDRARSAAPDRRHRGRRHDRAGDAAVRSG